jgi:hypothetical protein
MQRSVLESHAFVDCMDNNDSHHNDVTSAHITDELNTSSTPTYSYLELFPALIVEWLAHVFGIWAVQTSVWGPVRLIKVFSNSSQLLQ